MDLSTGTLIGQLIGLLLVVALLVLLVRLVVSVTRYKNRKAEALERDSDQGGGGARNSG
ncbi:hypothetical protein [Wenzhouxiangella sp. EGI_FJ10305]|uniref:hypothetical protein n=1 Tax=Wenzhouxiangella sp. EGI_FJ10305 TaxID=3243768 RepID=UPI0035E3073D